MRAGDLFFELYQIDKIKEVYKEKLINKCSPGLDRVNRRIFEEQFDDNVTIINRKVLNGTYKFTSYKQKIISKGAGKEPRVISIPTIRDKITLIILKNIIVKTFGNEVTYSVIHRKISDIVNSIKQYNFDCFFKIDLSKYYDSIDQNLLLKRLKSRIKKKDVLNLIEKAIKTPTVEENYSKGSKKLNEKGIPQGLSISNPLASLYLSKFDKKHEKKNNYKYFRFVDDILILCCKKDLVRVKTGIECELEQQYFLKINQEKEDSGEIANNEISYLGYLISHNNISVRPSSVRKLELSIEKLFKEYAVYRKYNLNLFVWKLNIKITGLIKDGIKMGWVFFFSQITNEKVFFHLDWLVKKYIKRFKLENDLKGIKLKRYVRTYKEIRNNLHGTTYIPNLDKYSLDDQRDFIKDVLGIDTSTYSDIDIMEIFEKEAYKFAKELERDLQHFS